jgi:type VI protein secretion system component VasK
MVNAAWSAVRTTARSFAHVLHLLWLEVTGVIFLIMALSFGGATMKEYGKFHAGHAGPGRMEAALLFTILFAWFGLTSFWRVRRKSQRP